MTERRKILVVDDERSIVDAVSTALRYEGYEVTEARTGRSALASAQSSSPSLAKVNCPSWIINPTSAAPVRTVEKI